MEIIYFAQEEAQTRHPFYRKNLVFTGALSTMTRSEAAKRVRTFEATLQGAVSNDTHFVILGDKRKGVSTKERKAQQLIALGHDIQIIEEDDFLWLLAMNK